MRGAIQQMIDSERKRHLLHPTRDHRGCMAPVFQGKSQLRAHRAHHKLRLGVLEENACHGPKSRRGMLMRVKSPNSHAPRERSAVEMRHKATGGAQQRGLPMTGKTCKYT